MKEEQARGDSPRDDCSESSLEDEKDMEEVEKVEDGEDLSGVHPQRNTFLIDGMTITSDFDSGNLKMAEKLEDGRVSQPLTFR